MNLKQKKFILEKLVPFVLREQGRGFGMSGWRSEFDGNDVKKGSWDNIFREVPKCNTVACIGGSIEVLMGMGRGELQSSEVVDILGISEAQAGGLFYFWAGKKGEDGSVSESGYGWPQSFKRRFAQAKTTLGKAKIAVALLREVVKTNGNCLNPKE